MIFSLVHAQDITVSGYITDLDTNEALIDAIIYDEQSGRGTYTNNYGYYSLSLHKNKAIELNISYVGYKVERESFTLSDDISLNFLLETDNSLEEVVITTQTQQSIEKRNDLGSISISVKKIKTLPSIGGESDVLKAFQLMPGVLSGNEGSSSLFVRGGSPDQNLILLDDVPLYYVNHFGGFVSVFNTDAINKVKLIKGGFPASYGGRLSSVIDVRMKEGNRNEFHGSGMIGLIASKASVEGPIVNSKTSYTFSYRRMLFDLITKTVSLFNEKPETSGYYFYDLNAKVNHKFSDNDHIYFSLYMGDDEYYKSVDTENGFKKKQGAQWGNILFALRWNHLFNQKLFGNLVVSHTKYRLKVENDLSYTGENELYELKYNQGIFDTNVKMNFNYYPTNNYKMIFGVKSTLHSFNPGELDYKHTLNNTVVMDTIVRNNIAKSYEVSAYVENKVKIGDKLAANLGLHYNSYHINNVNYHSFEPRILLNWNFTPLYALKASYTKMQQNVHLLTSGNVSLPVDLWIPATERTPPQKSEQFSVGISKSSKNGKYEMSLETYFKTSQNLITYKEGVTFYNITNSWEDKIEREGIGKSYGIEFLARKNTGNNTGWLSYTLSKTDREFEGVNLGKPYPYHYDRRHSISFVYQYQINKNINLSATWVYNTGKAITIADGRYFLQYSDDNIDQEQGVSGIEVYNHGKNGFRMRDFHKLDVGVNFRKEKKWGERTWNISIYNVYNRQNPHYYYFGSDDGYTLKLKQQSLFPILPSVSYSFKF